MIGTAASRLDRRLADLDAAHPDERYARAALAADCLLRAAREDWKLAFRAAAAASLRGLDMGEAARVAALLDAYDEGGGEEWQ